MKSVGYILDLYTFLFCYFYLQNCLKNSFSFFFDEFTLFFIEQISIGIYLTSIRTIYEVYRICKNINFFVEKIIIRLTFISNYNFKYLSIFSKFDADEDCITGSTTGSCTDAILQQSKNFSRFAHRKILT